MNFSTTVNLADLGAAYLKANYLTGLKICDDNGEEFPDSFFENKLNDAVAQIQELTNVDILKRVNVAETHDYHVTDYLMYAFMQLYRMPALSVSAVRAVYPTGQVVQIFPSEWIRLEKAHSQINLVPTSGSLSNVLIGQGLDYVLVTFSGVNYLPSLWEVDYISGFEPDAIPRVIADAIGKYAAIEVLRIASELVTPLGQTSQSLSVDGLSQSRSYQLPAFQARINAYIQDLYGANTPSNPGLLGQIRHNYRGILLASV